MRGITGLALLVLNLCFVPALSFCPGVQSGNRVPTRMNRPRTLFSGKLEDPNNKKGSSEEEIEAALEQFKQQSQIKAFGVLAVAFSSFVYLKLQYDADPSSFLGSH